MASITPASQRKIMRQLRQREATTGRRVPQSYIEALIRQELEVSASRATQNRALEIQKETSDKRLAEESRQFNEQLALNRSAAKVGGIADLATAGLTGAMLLKDTKVGKAVGGSIKDAGSAAYSGVKNLFTGASATQAASVAPTAANIIGTSAAPVGGAGTAAALAAAPGTAAAPAIGHSAALYGAPEAAVSQGAALGGSATQATATGTGFGAVAGPAAIGAGAGRLGANLLFGDSSTAEDIGTIGGAAAVGTLIAPGIGTAIGAGIGIVTDVVSDAAGTIICTELYRQGYIPLGILKLDGVHRKLNVDDETYAGYLRLATPLVNLMKKSKLVTRIVAPFGIAWAHEMASRVDDTVKGSVLGKTLYEIGVPICRVFSKKEVCCG